MTDTATKTDILGICTAIGRDVGFHPDILRVALAFGLFVSPLATLGVYALLGATVLASRWLFPDVKRADAAVVPAAPALEAPVAHRLAA